jgi:hypothetical protein
LKKVQHDPSFVDNPGQSDRSGSHNVYLRCFAAEDECAAGETLLSNLACNLLDVTLIEWRFATSAEAAGEPNPVAGHPVVHTGHVSR